MLKQNETLSGLSESQLTAIAEMSKNDENTVIGTKIGALHGQYDADIFGITGIAKNNGEKSYDYAKRVLNEYKTQIGSVVTIQTQLDAANKQVEELKSKIASGAGDETLKQQLKDAKAQVTQLQTQLTTKETEFNEAKAQLEGQIKNVQIDYAFRDATKGLKFKSGITDSLQNVLLMSAKAEVLTKGTPDFIDDGTGNKKLVFRDKDGNVLNNPSNNLNPYTVSELLMQTSIKDAIDTGKQQPGGGTKPVNIPGGNPNIIDLTGVKTQVEADKKIEAYLLAEGLTRDSEEFSSKLTTIRSDNKVSELPIR
jgi:hypothetical protein